MTYKTLLVHVEAGGGSDGRVKLATQVAGLFDAAIIGLGAEGFYPILSSGYAAVDGALIEAVRERIAADLPVAEKRFRELTAGVAAGVEWITGYDYPHTELALHARGADLIVATRPPRQTGAAYAASPADLLMRPGIPVLLAPDSNTPLSAETVVVAWKDTREARRAVSDAMPFLVRAKKVVVLAISGDSDPGSESAGVKAVAQRIKRQGANVEAKVVPRGKGTVAEDIEQEATRVGADLIVMGAYGHSRLREWALGGATEDLLAASSKFILFSH
ncbi:MAG: universal stress protein [Caulobacteraceae bacterium]|nr:universal stress protein [Caulobacteraceae bacterium]